MVAEDPVIKACNMLRTVFNKVKLDGRIQFPQIIVVGGQSTGKSSVLESVIGRGDILPRGIDTVTRAPIRLQLIPIDAVPDDGVRGTHFVLVEKLSDDDANSSFMVGATRLDPDPFAHGYAVVGNEKKIRLEDVVTEIGRLMKAMQTAMPTGICDEEIDLKIYLPNVVNITLVDLPGMVQYAKDDEEERKKAQILQLIDKYAKEENTIIMAVSSAVEDIATSAALGKAKEHDRNGDRTMAVFTKMDLMDKGAEVEKLLQSPNIHAKHGVIGVINRSQLDAKNNRNIDHALAYEQEFLDSRCPSIKRFHGMPYLKQRLSEILRKHINEKLPALKNVLRDLKRTTELELKNLGPVLTDDGKRREELINAITTFNDKLRDELKTDDLNTPKQQPHLNAGARTRRIFNINFHKDLWVINPLADLSPEKIYVAIKNAAGVHTAIMPPSDAFHSLSRIPIEKLRKPSQDCLKQVQAEMLEAVRRCLAEMDDINARLPNLISSISDEMSNFIMDCENEARRLIDYIVQMELSGPNTDHPEFQRSIGEAKQKLTNGHTDELKRDHPFEAITVDEIETAPGARENLRNPLANRLAHAPSYYQNRNYDCLDGNDMAECRTYEDLLTAYFNIVRGIVEDAVPKAIICTLVNALRSKTVNMLTNTLQITDTMAHLFTESRQVAEKRRQAIETVQACTEGLHHLITPFDLN